MKTLVVYYSRKGYTEKIAFDKVRSEKEKGDEVDFLCLETLSNTAGFDGFRNCLVKSASGGEMELFPYETDVASYDKVIVCTPVWCGKTALPMKAFLTREKHNINKAEYVIVHFLDSNMDAVADEIDKILRLKRDNYTSIQCVWGKIKKEEEKEVFSDD